MTQESAVLMLLRSGPQTTHSLCNSVYSLASEYRRAISTLRNKGYDIRARRVRKGEWEYRLVGQPLHMEASGQLALSL